VKATRDFHGEAAGVAAAPLEDCFSLLASVDRYPDWCSEVVTAVEVLERGADGHPTKVRARMRVARAGFQQEFDLFLAIVVEPPETVRLTRVTDHPTNQEFDATWSLTPAASTRIALQLDAKLRVPWYIPATGIADSIAAAFVDAACNALTGRGRG
jgi:ribosome-associated toxin RatA of RatAB toxin-antitoxin module